MKIKLGLMLGGVILIGIALITVLPLFNRAREGPNLCQANLRSIGNAIKEYRSTHEGRFPYSFSELLASSEEITADAFICPATDHEKAPGETNRETALNLRVAGHLSYIYCADELPADSPPDTVLVCEPLSNHDGQRASVLLIDGTVRGIDQETAARITSAADRHVRPVRLAIPGPTTIPSMTDHVCRGGISRIRDELQLFAPQHPALSMIGRSIIEGSEEEYRFAYFKNAKFVLIKPDAEGRVPQQDERLELAPGGIRLEVSIVRMRPKMAITKSYPLGRVGEDELELLYFMETSPQNQALEKQVEEIIEKRAADIQRQLGVLRR